LASVGGLTPVAEASAQAEQVALVDEELRDAVWAARVEALACAPEQADDPAFRSSLVVRAV